MPSYECKISLFLKRFMSRFLMSWIIEVTGWLVNQKQSDRRFRNDAEITDEYDLMEAKPRFLVPAKNHIKMSIWWKRIIHMRVDENRARGLAQRVTQQVH